jgi:hypothetical protein
MHCHTNVKCPKLYGLTDHLHSWRWENIKLLKLEKFTCAFNYFDDTALTEYKALQTIKNKSYPTDVLLNYIFKKICLRRTGDRVFKLQEDESFNFGGREKSVFIASVVRNRTIYSVTKLQSKLKLHLMVYK